MRTITLALAVLVAACGGGGTEAPVASAPPPVVQPPADRVAFIGDSITQYWDAGGQAHPDPKLIELVPSEINAGMAGDRTDMMLARFSAVLEKRPTVVVILGGTNDLRQVSVPTVDNIAVMAERAAAGGARVILCMVPPASVETYPTSVAPTDAVNDSRIRAFNTQLRNLAAGFGYSTADYYSALTNPDGSLNAGLFGPERIHPNEAGYRAMWPVLRRRLAELGVAGMAQ